MHELAATSFFVAIVPCFRVSSRNTAGRNKFLTPSPPTRLQNLTFIRRPHTQLSRMANTAEPAVTRSAFRKKTTTARRGKNAGPTYFMKFFTPFRTLLTVAFRLRMRRSIEGTTTCPPTRHEKGP